jgi:unsaturated chondroitin disaccharide hydrolase
MLKTDQEIKIEDLSPALTKFWDLSAEKIILIKDQYDESGGSPVFTVKGKYSTRGWTEWTQGFLYGSALLQFNATGEKVFLDYAREGTVGKMAPHLSNTGVHDHGFNNISTYGNLLRLMVEGKILRNEWEMEFYKLALKISGAVQASRWTTIKDGGFIYSFNGPHSLFVDTIRSCRSLIVSHLLGHMLKGEGDISISLLGRALQHLKATAEYSVFYGEGRDTYDVYGRTAHESVFNVNDGTYRCPATQQGYSAFSTWTRGLAWAMCGFSEQLEWIDTANEEELSQYGGRTLLTGILLKAARAVCDFYIASSPADGVPYWDTGAPGLVRINDYMNKPADPFNPYEPVDSSAAAIGAQGLLRLGNYLIKNGEEEEGTPYWQAGLRVVQTLLKDPYLSLKPDHQGLLLHSVYHRPNGWDYVPEGSRIPCGESSMWGDYHLREVCLYLHKLVGGEKYYTFFNCIK